MVSKIFRGAVFALALAAVPIAGSGSAGAVSGALLPGADVLSVRSGVVEVQSRRANRNAAFAALRVLVAPGGTAARTPVSFQNGPAFVASAASIFCRLNPNSVGCGLVSPTIR